MAALSSKTKPNYVRLIPSGDCHYCGLVAAFALLLQAGTNALAYSSARAHLRLSLVSIHRSLGPLSHRVGHRRGGPSIAMRHMR